MRKIIRKLTSILLAAVLLLTSVSFAASAATIDETKQPVGASSGTTGACTWTLDDDGTLTISGNGAMVDYDATYSNDTWITTAPA